MAKRLVACLITIFMLFMLSAATFAQFDGPPPPGGPGGDADFPPPPPNFNDGDEPAPGPGPVPAPPPPQVQPSAPAEQQVQPIIIIEEEGEEVQPTMEVVGTAAVSTEKNWMMFRGNAQHSGFWPEQIELPLSLMWRQIVKLNLQDLQRNSGNPSSPSVADGVIYFCSGEKIHAINADTGSLRWVYPAEGKLGALIKTTPLIGKDLLYVGAGNGRLYAITKDDGKLAWSFSTKGIMNSSPVLADDTIFVGSSDDCLYALDPDTGQQKWKSGFKTHDDISGSPAVANGMVYFMSDDMMLYCAYTSTGRLKWSARVGTASRVTTPVISGNNVYAVAGNSLQCLLAQSGRLMWSAKMPEEITSMPAVSDRGIYVVCKKKLYCLTLAGAYKWKQPVDLGSASTSAPTIVGDYVIVGNNKGAITVVNKDTGTVAWKYVITPAYISGAKLPYTGINGSPVVSNGTLYVASDDGSLSAFNTRIPDKSVPYVTAVQPIRDYLMPGTPPVEIAAVIKEPGSGINEQSLQMLLDGEPVKHKFIPERGIIWYKTVKTQPIVPLADGRHTVTVMATDWAGNQMKTEWSFRVDNSLRVAPDASKTGTQQQTPGMMMPGMPGMMMPGVRP